MDEVQGAPSRGRAGGGGLPEEGSNEEDRPSDPRSDPWKGFRGVCSGILILEMIAVLLAVPVVSNLSAPSLQGLGWLPTAFVLCYAALLFWACAAQKKPWALALDVGLQFVLVAAWFLHPALGIMGLIFLLVWVLVWRMQRAVLRAQGSGGNG